MKLDEVFRISPNNIDRVYDRFRASYEASVGSSWSKDKFEARAALWSFYGDEDGFIAAREQRSGMLKLVGAAGNPKGILKGISELEATGKPVWGAVSQELALAAKKRGMIVPHLIFGGPTIIKMIAKNIPRSVFGGHEPVITKDGGLKIDYDDVGTATKYLIGNKQYFSSILSNGRVMDQIKSLPGIELFLKVIT